MGLQGCSSLRTGRRWINTDTARKLSGVLLLILLSSFTCAAGSSGARPSAQGTRNSPIVVRQDSDKRDIKIRWTLPSKTHKTRVSFDDSPAFRQPILQKVVKGRSLKLDIFQAGLAPGVTYYVRLEPGNLRAQFRLDASSWNDPALSSAYLHRAWETSGRNWLYVFSGVRWHADQKKWELDQKWPDAENDVGPQAYYVEHAARGAVQMGLVCRDVPLLDELAQFYTTYLARFTTLGELRRRKSLLVDTSPLNGRGDDSARTLLWVQKIALLSRITECSLCNSQFFHPAARLIRVITTLPESERTPAMNEFVKLYAPLITRDHLIRLLYEADWDYWGARDLPKHLVEIWQTILNPAYQPTLSYQKAMFDWDLWLISTAAEILGANANEPELVPLQADEKKCLQDAVRLGVQLFQSKRRLYPDTKDLRGHRVSSASYFNGDLDDHEEMAYSAYTGKTFPTGKDKGIRPGTSWDISHSYRIPIFLRSLYDNKKATGLDFPSTRDIELVVNEFVYKVFRGDFERPLFNNFLDGSNGWFRVGYHGRAFGYPPAQYCDSRSEEQPCLIDGGLQGWGLLAFFNPDLMKLERALLQLAERNDTEAVPFKERYYHYHDQSFSFGNTHGQEQYPMLLFWILAGVPEKLESCGSR